MTEKGESRQSPIRTCSCGAQTSRHRCINCERQDAADLMLDRIRDILKSLDAHTTEMLEPLETLLDAPSRSMMWAIWWQDLKDLINWYNMTHALKFSGLTIGEQDETLDVIVSVKRDWPKRIEELIAEHRRARIRVVE